MSTEEGEWNVVVMETKSLAAEWDQISIYLGLPFDLIKGIKSVAGDCYQHWSEALHQWIRQNYNTKKFGDPSWRTLLKAIAGVDKRKFKKLASSHECELSVFLCDVLNQRGYNNTNNIIKYS